MRDALNELVTPLGVVVARMSALARDRYLPDAAPERAQDLIVQGINLVGGGGMLRGLDQRLTEETDVQVRLVDLPLECVALGAGRCIESYEALKVMFMEDNTRR